MASSGSIWVSLGLKTAKFSKGIKQARGELTGFEKLTKGVGKGLGRVFSPENIGLAGVLALGAAFVDAWGRIKDFDSSIKNLSAITGATGKDLEYLKDQAINLGSASTLSASQVADGFKLIASAKPELLSNAKALSLVTEKTILLAEAAKIDMAEAADAVTLSLNQFSKGSESAGKFVDILAAGSKMGAGDINFLKASLQKTGGIASKAGLSFIDTASALETLAPVMATGEEAGTAFRNILVNLQKAGIGFKSGQFDINDALEESKQKFDSIKDPIKKASAQVDLFGKQNLAAGQQLINNIGTFNDFQVSLDENGIAAKQAATNNDTFEGSVKSMDSAYEGFILTVEDGSGVFSQSAKGLTDDVASMLSSLTELNKFDFKEFWSADSVRGVGNELAKLGGVLGGIVNPELGKFSEKLQKQVNKSLNETTDKFATLTQEQLSSKNAIKTVTSFYTSQGFSLDEARYKYDKLREASLSTAKASNVVVGAVGALGAGLESTTKSVTKLTSAQKQLAAASKKMREEQLKTANIDLVPKLNNASEALRGIQQEIESMPPMALKIPVTTELEVTSTPDNLEQDTVQMGIDAGKALSDALQGAAIDGLVGLGEAMAGGIDPSEMGAKLANGFAGILDGFGKQLIAMGVAMLAAQAAIALGPLGAGLAIAAGVTLVATASAIKNNLGGAEPMAKGAMVTGSVFANVGEGRGTTKSNPEIIAPLDKLKNMIADVGGSGGGNVTFRIEGSTLVGILNRENKNVRYSS